MGDVALVDRVRLTDQPPSKIPNLTAQVAGNPVVFWCYTFIPRVTKEKGGNPLLVLPRGGVHSDMISSYSHIIRELIQQGYLVIAPEYRGSTGYG